MIKLTRQSSFGALLGLALAGAGALLLPPFEAVCGATPALVQEIDSLLATLDLTDPSRGMVKLRLADVLFSTATDLENNIDASGEEKRLVPAYRKRALSIYGEAMAGSAQAPAPQGAQRARIRFQMARLLNQLQEQDQAKLAWSELLKQSDAIDIQHEAAIQLGEISEQEHGGSASLERADGYFQKAIQICDANPSMRGSDRCNYAHYRRGWLLQNLGRHQEAIAELKLCLVDTKGRVREEALRDLVMFWSTTPATSEAEVGAAMADLDVASKRTGRAGLLEQLSDGYYAAGNKYAGTLVLDRVNAQTPKLKFQARLLEEFYGKRDWIKFRALLSELANAPVPAPVPVSAEKASDSTGPEPEVVLRRLIVQLDGQRISEPQYAGDFKASALLYLRLYPSSKERPKMIDGWLAAETDGAAKLKRLGIWVASRESSAVEEIRLRKIRAAVAQDLKDNRVVADEMALIAAATTDSAKRREYQYVRARALYELKDFDQALPLFKSLAQAAPPPVDKWSIQSQHLAMDILNQQKKYDDLVAQAEKWTKNPALRKQADVAKELVEMDTIAEQARFEGAVAKGDRPEALAVFSEYCLAGKLLPKSCENAKVLAVKLKKQETLIAVLEASQGTSEELLAEYEASGLYAQAAALLQKIQPKPNYRGSMKLALLYELAQDQAGRDQALRHALLSLTKPGVLQDAEEALLLRSAMDAGMLSANLLSLPWASARRLQIANDLELAGQGTAATHDLLLGSAEQAGKAWADLVVHSIQELDVQQRAAGFYGKASQTRFKKRLALFEAMVQRAEHYLPGADAPTRVRIAQQIEASCRQLAQEISSTPLPQGLNDDAAKQIQASLAEMAAPFLDRAATYAKVAADQHVKPEPVAPPAMAAAGEKARHEDSVRAAALADLKSDPANSKALFALKGYYDASSNPRLAAYFEGRIKQLNDSAPTAKGGSR